MNQPPNIDRLPPHSEKMERAVLGCLLEKPGELLPECEARFKCGPEVFYDLRHQIVYEAILHLHHEAKPVDLVTVLDQLKSVNRIEEIGGLDYLASFGGDVESTLNFSYYADRVADAFMQRRTLAACVEAAAQVYESQKDADEVITGIEQKLQSIRDLRSNEVVVEGLKSGNLLLANLENRFNLKGAKSGVVTGLYDFDRLTDGLQYGEQTIIGARPSQGKTALATTVIYRACLLDKIPTLVITLEMSIETLCRRILANHSRVPMGNLRAGTFGEADFSKFANFAGLLSRSPIYFMDAISGCDSARICAAIKRLAKNNGVKLVVIDYLQPIKATGIHEKRTYEVAQVSGALKAAAVESGAALLTLAQLNREPDQQKGRAPRLSDLADSGQIERDGDCIGLLERSREPGQGHQAKIHIAKQRDGEIGIVDLHFIGEFCVFENVSKVQENE